MTSETKELMENLISAGETGNEAAIRTLRGIAQAAIEKSPTPCLIALAKFIARSGFDQNIG